MKSSDTSYVQDIKALVAGEVDTSDATRELYSHDASLFEIKPQVVVAPKTTDDIKALVKYVSEHKAKQPDLSLTARSAGTDMSGGAINDSVIVDFSKHFTHLGAVTDGKITTQPGVFYRDFEKETLKSGLLMPSYPASRELCMMGGIVNNNSGGELSLTYGKTINYVTKVKIVLRDGNEYVLEPLNREQLDVKMKQTDVEGEIYRDVFKLVDTHYDEIKAAKPKVTKNSTGYNVWDVWDRETGIFDLSKAIIGAQGTLGFVTEAELKLVKTQPLSGLLVAFMPSLDHLGDIINAVLETKPTSFESFDDHTMFFAIRFFPTFLKTLGWKKFISLMFSLIPEALMLFKGLPKLILMVEYKADTQEEIDQKVHHLHEVMKPFNLAMEEANTQRKSNKFWIMRRESFNLLRKNVKDKHTAPFIDDFVVPPAALPEFLPQLRAIVEKYRLLYTIAGHVGNGNFHIIPLMRLQDPEERAKLEPAMREVNALVLKYGGSLSGEHNDGLVRGPFLDQMYSPAVMGYFRELKHIFDPQNIFNPHKKVTADWKYSHAHIRDHF
jgi:FAD/FMN-containing dehydrogenase